MDLILHHNRNGFTLYASLLSPIQIEHIRYRMTEKLQVKCKPQFLYSCENPRNKCDLEQYIRLLRVESIRRTYRENWEYVLFHGWPCMYRRIVSSLCWRSSRKKHTKSTLWWDDASPMTPPCCCLEQRWDYILIFIFSYSFSFYKIGIN